MQNELFALDVTATIYTGETVRVIAQDDKLVTFVLNGQTIQKTHYIFEMMTGLMCKQLYKQGVMQ